MEEMRDDFTTATETEETTMVMVEGEETYTEMTTTGKAVAVGVACALGYGAWKLGKSIKGKMAAKKEANRQAIINEYVASDDFRTAVMEAMNQVDDDEDEE